MSLSRVDYKVVGLEIGFQSCNGISLFFCQGKILKSNQLKWLFEGNQAVRELFLSVGKKPVRLSDETEFTARSSLAILGWSPSAELDC